MSSLSRGVSEYPRLSEIPMLSSLRLTDGTRHDEQHGGYTSLSSESLPASAPHFFAMPENCLVPSVGKESVDSTPP